MGPLNKSLLLLLIMASIAFADTPPPGTVKAKMFTGDGVTGITATGTALNVNVANTTGLTTVNQGTAGASAWLVSVANASFPVTGTFWQSVQPISASALPLPTGASTSSLQTTGNTSLASIDTKTPPLGQALAAGSVPVVLTASQLTSLTPPTSISVSNFPSSQAVTGAFFQATQPVSLASLPALATGANTIGAVNINGTVPISGTITATNAANGSTGSAAPTIATLVGGSDGTNLRALKTSSTGVLSVDGSAVTQPVSGTVTANAGTGTFAVSAAALPLPTGAATAAKQPALGTSGSASSDVITVQGIASMTALKVDGSAVTQPVSAASLPLPTGAATAAGLTTINTTLGIPMQQTGGTVTANAGIGTFAVSAAALPLPSGASTSALQTTGNTSLASIDTKTPALVSGSVPVTVTSATPDFSGSASLTAACSTPASCPSNSTVTLTTNGISSAVLEIQGTWSGNVLIEGSNDGGANWQPRSIVQTAPTPLNATGVTTNGYWRGVGVGGYKLLRARMSTYVSGTAVVTLVASTGSDLAPVVNLIPANLQVASYYNNSGTQVEGSADGSGNVNVNVVNSPAVTVSGVATSANQSTMITSLSTIATNSGTQATAANQTSGNTSLSSIATNTANIPAKGLAAVTASTPVALSNATTVTTAAFTSVTGTLNTDMLTGSASGWYDAAGYTSFFADIYTTTTVTGGVVTFEQTNDTTNDAAGITMNLQDSTVLTQTNVTSYTFAASTVKHYQAPITSRYIRFRISTAFAGTGTVGATVNFRQTPYTPIVYPVSQATAASLANTSTIASGTVTTVSTVTSVTSDNLAIPGTVADVASGAIVSTTTSATFTPANGVGFIVNMPVTAAAGTGTFIVQVQESADAGTNWFTIYTFPTVNVASSVVSNGASQTSPVLPLLGNRVRYVQTLTGITSVTRAINRLQVSAVIAAPVNNNATFATATVSSSCSTLSAPVNAIGFILENLSSNTVNMFWTIGSTAATSTTGMLLEPGRDTGEVHAGQNISLCSASGTPTYSLQWIQQ